MSENNSDEGKSITLKQQEFRYLLELVLKAYDALEQDCNTKAALSVGRLKESMLSMKSKKRS